MTKTKTKTSKPKRGRGRPQKQAKPEGATLREAAAHFGITRARLLRWEDEGCPGFHRVNERVFVSLDKVVAWRNARDEEDSPQIPAAKVYHPSDSRYRVSVASGKIRQRTLDLNAGRYVTDEYVRERMREAFGSLEGALKILPAMLFDVASLTPDTAEDALAPLIDDALSSFRLDDDSKWPQPMAIDGDDLGEPADGSEFETPQHDYVPVLPSSDPRAIEATIKADALEAKLAVMETTTFATHDMRLISTAIAEETRRIVRMLPRMVADALGEGRDVQSVIEDKIEVVKILIRGPGDDVDVAKALDIVTGGKPYTIVERVQARTIAADAPAGSEFDLPETADLDAVLAALASYPDINTGAVSEFG